jgi:surfeit locus 1 family protein
MYKKQSILTQTVQQNRISLVPSLVPLLAALIVSIVTASLGAWQLRRADEKRDLASVRTQAEIGSAIALSGTESDFASLSSRKISVRGKFENDKTVFIDNRGYQGKAGVHVVTPFLIEGSNQRIAVLRGWSARDLQDRAKLPTIPALYDTIEISGLAQATLGKSFDLAKLGYVDPAQMAVPAATEHLWQQFDPKPYAQWLGTPMLPILLRQFSATNDGLVRDWARPADEVAKHQGYAVQWFALSGVTIVLWFYLVVIRPRRLLRMQATEQTARQAL